jgi:muramidase (phage lysozyme)
LAKYFDAYKSELRLPDFSPTSQDSIALQQIKECGALPAIDAGRFAEAIRRCAHIWASLPSAGYEQHENKLSDLQDVFIQAGGVLA